MKSFLFGIIFLFPIIVMGQWHDRVWNTHSTILPTGDIIADKYDFSTTPPTVEKRFASPNSFHHSSIAATICDSIGNELFYTDGYRILNNQLHNILEPDIGATGNIESITQPQIAIVLPNYRTPNSYLLLYYNDYEELKLWQKKDLNMLRLDSVMNGNTGNVTYKNKKISDDKHNLYLAATKHANGMDWWLTTIEASDSTHSNFKHLVYLVTGDSLELKHEIPFGDWSYGNKMFFGEVTFSPNGDFLCYTDRHDGIFVWDFDRCTGMLSNFRYDEYDESLIVYYGSIEVSPNSRFVYVHSTYYILQYDLLAADFSGSKNKIAEYDGYHNRTLSGGLIRALFSNLKLAPDGRMFSYNGGSWHHQILYPNRKGQASEPSPRSFKNYAGGGMLSNHPHYRLGPIDGSGCDTLGLDNHPLADFRWDYTQEVTGDPLWAQFTDNSFYEPETWYWDFGDGSTSTDTCPAHTFPAPGIYTVCMTVCNQNSCDTICKDVEVGQVYDDLVADFNHKVWDHIIHDTFRVEYFGENYLYPVTYSWDFRDGSTATGQIQDHTYDLPGFYEVCLIVCNNFMCDTLCKEVQVGGTGALMQARFSVLSSDTTTVTFRDQSIVNPTGWTWDFGDGASSIEQQPTHTFDAPGIYSVCLEACNTYGLCDTECKDITVDAANISFVAHFGFSIDSNTVQFVDQSLSDPISWTWDFGDGTGSTEQSPQHLYSENGIYEVCLIACSAFLCDTFCSTVVIETLTSQTAEQPVQAQLFSIQPNPVRDMLFIKKSATAPSQEALICTFYDSMGRQIFQKNIARGQQNCSISTAEWSSGLYFYEIKNEQGKELQVGKVIRE